MILSALISSEKNTHIFSKKRLVSEMCEHDKAQYSNYVDSKDKLNHLVSRFLLKQLGNMVNKEFRLSEIKFTNFGKPFSDKLPYFSITHSNHYCAVAVSDSNSVGVDIQFHKPISIHDYAQMLTAEEYKKLSDLKQHDRLALFYQWWTIKEAIMKADGRGFYLSPTAIVEQYGHYVDMESGVRYYLKPTPEVEGYTIAIASTSGNEAIKWYYPFANKLEKIMH